jgi:hypothetical protein
MCFYLSIFASCVIAGCSVFVSGNSWRTTGCWEVAVYDVCGVFRRCVQRGCMVLRAGICSGIVGCRGMLRFDIVYMLLYDVQLVRKELRYSLGGVHTARFNVKSYFHMDVVKLLISALLYCSFNVCDVLGWVLFYLYDISMFDGTPPVLDVAAWLA